MNILIGVNNWDVGGAENFVFDLVKNLSKSGHSVTLFIMYDHGFYKDKLDQLFGDEKKKIRILNRYSPWKGLDHLLWILNGLGNKFGFPDTRKRFLAKSSRKSLKNYIRTENIEVANTHLFETDEFIALNADIPQVVSMHGPYETYLNSDNEYGIVGLNGLNDQFIKRAEYVLNKARNIVYVADKNLGICKHFDSSGINKEKIYYGYSKLSNEHIEDIPGDDIFTFGMVARGVEAKGWEIAIQSFLELTKITDRQVKLQLLYTESEYMQELKQKHEGTGNIEFLGFVEGKAKETYQRAFDVTLLTTHDDCLPVSIIESIMLNIPVISTQVGEIQQMLTTDGKQAGVVLPLGIEDGKPAVSDVADAMKGYLEDAELYQAHKMNTKECSNKFSMANCISRYESAYKLAVNSNQEHS